MKRPTLRLWDALSLYLPILLMGLLALGSWWLVRTAPKPAVSTTHALPSDQPDYRLENFSTQQFDAQGQLRSQLWGEAARHFPSTDSFEVDQVRTRSLGLNGVVSTTSAARGISNSDSSEVQLLGNAEVRRSYPAGTAPDMVLQGEFLHAWPHEERVRSHLPVVLQRGADRFTGNNLEYDNLSQVLQLTGQVRGELQPKR